MQKTVIHWTAGGVEISRTDDPSQRVEIPEEDLPLTLATIIAEAAGKPERLWDVYAWLQGHPEALVMQPI